MGRYSFGSSSRYKIVEVPAGTKFYLSEKRLDAGGYDDRGRYYGRTNERLYEFESATRVDGEYLSGEFRARDRKAAKALMRKKFPGATFFN